MNVTPAQIAAAHDLAPQVEKIAPNTFHVPASDGGTYTVALHSPDSLTCGCPWGRRVQIITVGVKPCKHALAVAQAGHTFEAPAATEGGE